mgnify:CR=1 FL=1
MLSEQPRFTRATLARHLAVTLFGAKSRTTSTTGGTATMVDTRLAAFPDDYFIGWSLYFETGANIAADSFAVTDFVSSTGTVTFAPAGVSTTSGDRYILIPHGLDMDFIHRIIADAWRALRDACLVPYLNEELALVAGTEDYQVPFEHHILAAVADTGGSTTTIIDAALTQAADYWNGGLLVISSGGALGDVRLISDFNATTDTLTVIRPFTSTPAIADTYDLHKFQPRAITELWHLDDNSVWQRIPTGVWTLQRYGQTAQLHFYNQEDTHDFTLRAWAVPSDSLRIVGWRQALEPTNDRDPIELPDDAVIAWCHYLGHSYLAKQEALDSEKHIARLAEAWRNAQEALARHAVILPSTAVWV